MRNAIKTPLINYKENIKLDKQKINGIIESAIIIREILMEKVSVIIPTYNRENLIERSVRSVLNQTYENLEVIVVDDGSTDNTEEVVKSIRDERIIYFKQKNGGAAMARNTGVTLATADYIAFHDSDDVWREDKLLKQMQFLKDNPEYGMVYSNFKFHRLDGNSYSVPEDIKPIGQLSGDIFLTVLINNTVGAPTMVIRKELFEEIGGFNEALSCLEDWDFAIRFAENFYVGYIDEDLMDAYQQTNGVSSNGKDYFDIRCGMICKYKDVLWKNGLFDLVIGDLFKLAEKNNYLSQVKQILAEKMGQK